MLVWGLSERERVEELLPGGDEGEQARRDEPRSDQRQHDLVEDLQGRGAVDVGRLLEIFGKSAHEGREDPDRQGERQDQVAEDQGPEGVVEVRRVEVEAQEADVEPVDHGVEGAEDRDLWEDRHRKHQVERGGAPAKPEAPERVPGERADCDRDERHRAGDDGRVDERPLEVAARQHLAEVGERRMGREVLDRRVEQGAVRCECGADRPVERKRDVHEDQRDEEEERHAPCETAERAPLHPRTGRRPRRGLGDRAHCSSTRMNVT